MVITVIVCFDCALTQGDRGVTVVLAGFVTDLT